ncbi:sigma-70 family RNA polymerase sigma factor [Streptomyces chartreusis]|uniref:sigma-70 family RNA polymerase sigma factor n=1 Tax=Streptomyces chartreusis TaxID=1969 RepID=UPI0036A4A1A0
MSVIGSAAATDERERSLKPLYEEHRAHLHSYVLRLVGGDHHRAEDIVQETLLRCWRKHSLINDQSVRPWLFKVARNLVIDRYRMRLARPQEVDGASWLDQEPAEVDRIDQMLSSVVVREALEALSEAHRQVLHLTYFAGATIREASATLGIPIGTVKSRLFYALRSLKLALEERRVSLD